MTSFVLDDPSNISQNVSFGSQTNRLRIQKVEGVGIVCLTVNTGVIPDRSIISTDDSTQMLGYGEDAYKEFEATGGGGAWDLRFALCDYGDFGSPAGRGKQTGRVVIHLEEF